jgi:hypothetical protein
MAAEIVGDDDATVGPAAEDRPLQTQRGDDGVDVGGPLGGVAVPVPRLVRQAVAPQVHGHETQVATEAGTQLPAPGEPALREPVNEQDGAPLRVAGLLDVERRPRP